MSRPNVGNLVVYSQEGDDDVVLPSTSTRYRIVEAIVHLALSLLETARGRRVWLTGSSRRRPPPPHIYRDSLANMPYWIQRFLQSMRENFPPISISGGFNGEAAASKYDWGQDMNDYDAGGAGVLYVSEAIISNMTHVRQQASASTGSSYELFKFQMTISVAHEIVHFLTGFITGTILPDTPPAVTAVPYNDRGDVGEAGRYWESMFLGGFVECWSSTSDPLGPRQAGLPYLFNAGSKQSATGQQVSMSYVEEFLNEQFTFPIRASSRARPVTRRALERGGSRETTHLRELPSFRAAGRANSPTPSQAAAGTPSRFRRINFYSR
ncbi:hypothetical protein C8A00DRAFT_40211 [Chaetomidium leptoderma]|uniref:Uncharacterized protein n=1 Tax=Chaetomidium leptoderma TaxID=669021 RepID=A0AAN6VWD0_9PEZI|nr:hypothetical protein C8A00DRAFT_40211 [Chaetomidium leptoderma]